MPSTLKLTDGTTTVSLYQPTTNFGSQSESTEAVTLTGDNLWGSDQMALEPFSLVAWQASIDLVAVQMKALNNMIRKAQNYRRTLWQTTPVYIAADIGESLTRYALVYDCPDWKLADLYSEQLSRGFMRNFTLHLLREHPWRSAAPGVLPTITTLDAVDEPSGNGLGFVVNGQFTNAIDTIFNWHVTSYTGTPTYDTSGATAATSGTTCNVTLTVGNHSNGLLLVYIQGYTAGASTVAVTSNQAGTCVPIYQTGGVLATTNPTQVWAIIGPAQNVATTVTVTYSQTIGWAETVVGSYYNCDQSLPIYGLTLSSPTTTTISDVVPGLATYTLAVDFVTVYYSGGVPTLTVGGSQNSRQNVQGDTQNIRIGLSDKTGASSVTMAWTASNITSGQHFVFSIVAPQTGSFSANQFSTAAQTLWNASPAPNDCVYFGASGVGADAVIWPIGTAGVYTATIAFEYWNGTYWVMDGTAACILGTDYTVFPSGDVTSFASSIGPWAVFFQGKSTWAALSVNSITRFWLRLRIVSITSWTTSPVTNVAAYTCKSNYVEIPNTAFVGDARPVIDFRMFQPNGGGSTPTFATPSRVLMGAKNVNLGAGQFTPSIPLGNASLPTGWTTTYGTDTAAQADGFAPNGYEAHVTFATSATLIPRVTMVGTVMTQYFRGRYRVFARVRQNGGAAGDCGISLRTQIGGTTTGFPQYTLPTYYTGQHDAGWEVADLTGDGYLSLPFASMTAADSLAQDLDFLVYAMRNTGTSTLDLADLFLLPIDLMTQEMRDPVTDVTNGSSALRGNTMLEDDAGVLVNRLIKNIVSGANTYVAETWVRLGDIYKVEPNAVTRFYFMILNYPVSWGVGPLVAPIGPGMQVQVYGHSCYQQLRGNA